MASPTETNSENTPSRHDRASPFVTVLIPAYKPVPSLPDLVRSLLTGDLIHAVVVVDDGSDASFRHLLDELEVTDGVHVLRHVVNLGKGAALKTGLNFAACSFPDATGVVTADADGQHVMVDVLRVAEELVENPSHLVMGARQFGADVPLRSRFGNVLTRYVTRALVGQNLADTQTGLRGIPMDLIPRLMRSTAGGYEFEMDMLLICKRERYRIREVPIQTIYIEGNRLSHFNPILDSMRIYFLLVRFCLASIVTALIDNAVFAVVYSVFASILISQVTGRLFAMIFNYLAVRRVVFHSRERHYIVLPKYVLLVAVSGAVSYGLITSLVSWLSLPVIAAKLFAETLLFLANFVIQRDLVFFRAVRDAELASPAE